MNAFQSAVRAISTQYQSTRPRYQINQEESNYNSGSSEVPVPVPATGEDLYRERWEKTPRPKGRQAKDPNAEYVRFDCKDIDDLETCLSEYLQAPTAPAEHATVEFHFPITSAFMVYTRDFKRDSSTTWTSADVSDLMRKTAVSVMEVLQPTENAKDQIVRQKAVARTIVEAIQRADGFRYSFHNNWMSREDRAHRFSFFCNDSTLNKGRAANGGVGTEGRAKKKPVYDCKGLIAVKFSITKNNLEVHYRHVPVHKTYDERAPLPRKESKRYRMLEVLDPEYVKRLTKRQKREIQVKEKDSLKKRGRPRNLSGTAAEAGPANKSVAADASLQPVVDFLSSAERVTPAHSSSADNDAVSDNGDDDGISLAHNVDTQDLPGHDNSDSDTHAAIPTEKRGGSQSTSPPKPPKGRPKYQGPVLPGTMEGSLDSGNITWSDLSQTSATTQAKQTDNAKISKGRKEPGKDRNSSSAGTVAADSSLSELELLKQQLAATQERLRKLESDKQAPPAWNYPPYPYPYYPFAPPPLPVYYPPPLPPSGWAGNPPLSTPQRPPDFQFYQPQNQIPQSNTSPLHPEGPPHPHAIQTAVPAPAPATQTPTQPASTPNNGVITSQSQAAGLSASAADIEACRTVATAGQVNAANKALASSTKQTATSTKSQNAGESHSTDVSQPVAIDMNATSTPVPSITDRSAINTPARMQRAPTLQIPPPPPPIRRNEPLTGVLKLVDNDFVQRSAYNVSFQVTQNAIAAGPQKGKLKIVNNPSDSASAQTGNLVEDARMKIFFDSALAAIAGPQSAYGPPIIMYTPPNVNKASKSAPASAVAPQSQCPPPTSNWPPPYGYPPYPYQQNGQNRYAYPPPKQANPPPPQLSHTHTFVQPLTSTPVPPKPGKQPPPGYEALRAQMVAHAQAVPTPSPKETRPASVATANADRAETLETRNGKITSNAQAEANEAVVGVGSDEPVGENGETTNRLVYFEASSPNNSSVLASEPATTVARAISPQSISSDDSD